MPAAMEEKAKEQKYGRGWPWVLLVFFLFVLAPHIVVTVRSLTFPTEIHGVVGKASKGRWLFVIKSLPEEAGRPARFYPKVVLAGMEIVRDDVPGSEQSASDYLRSLTIGKKVICRRLRWDHVNRRPDIFGRYVATCRLADDPVDLAEHMVRAGYARRACMYLDRQLGACPADATG